jgi:hypothetical protein
MLKSSQVISPVSVEVKTSIKEISSLSINKIVVINPDDE